MMNCLRNARSLLSQITLRSKAPATWGYHHHGHAAARRLTMQDLLGLIRGSSAHIKPALPLPLRRQSTSPRSFVLRWYHDPRKATAATAIAAMSAAVMAACCRCDREIVPCTYRSHLVLYSHQEERDHADSAFSELKGKHVILDPSDPRSVRLRLIAHRIVHAAHRGLGIYDSSDAPMLRVTQKRRRWGRKAPPHTAHLRGLNWEVFLAKNYHPDVQIAASGKILASTGLFDRFKTDGEIAAILAHELGHVIARHTVDINNSCLLPTFLHNMFARRKEIEADYIGILLLGAAGFHPQWALVAMERRAKFEKGSVLGNIFFDHPKPEKQLQLLSEAKTMMEALELYREAIAMDKVTDRYFR